MEHGSTPAYMGRSSGEMKRLLESEPQSCPVCGYVGETMRQHIDTLFFERVNDIRTRAAIRAAGGFCRRHVRLVESQADALGTALICKDVLTNQLRAIEGGELDRPPETVRGISRLLEGGRGKPVRPPCPLCETEREFEELGVDGLLQALADRDFADLYRRSSGLCMPHFRLAFERCEDQDAWKVALDTEKRALTGLIGELSELARKSDYRFRQEGLGEEADSWRRGLHTTSGCSDG